MLTEEYIVNCSDDIVNLYNSFVDYTIQQMAKAIKEHYSLDEINRKTDILITAGELKSKIIKKIAKLNNMSEKEVAKVLEDAGKTTLKYDDAIYTKEGFDVIPLTQSPQLRNILEAQILKTNGELKNLTLTTANEVQKAFYDAVNNADLQVETGIYDYNTAIKNAIYDIVERNGGVGKVEYPSGYSSQLDVAVRRCVLTGVSNSTNALQKQRAEEMHAPYVDTSAHSGARPTHAEWQGKRFKYDDFINKPFGEAQKPVFEQLKEYNCRHSWYPVMHEDAPKARTAQQLEDINKKTVTSGGKEYTYYEAEQRLRYMERTVRKYKRRAMAIEQVFGDASHEKLKVRDWNRRIKKFCADTGIRRRPENEKVYYI